MLKDGEKGVIGQRGKEDIPYALAPHLPGKVGKNLGAGRNDGAGIMGDDSSPCFCVSSGYSRD